MSAACDFREDRFFLPHYECEPYFNWPVEELESASPQPARSQTILAVNPDSSANTSRPSSPKEIIPVADDMAVMMQPSFHVDYLSHDWTEEDIWASWKHISSRREDNTNTNRLENALWRTWMKVMNKLNIVSPETLNWSKDSDVTWLYGPFKIGFCRLVCTKTNLSSFKMGSSNSIITRTNPILKKRTVWELMHQRPVPSSSLVKESAGTGHAISPFPTWRGAGWKQIRFNEQVEQRIAIEVSGENNEGVTDMDLVPEYSETNDSTISMQRMKTRKTLPTNSSAVSKNKIISVLPSTNLKSREQS